METLSKQEKNDWTKIIKIIVENSKLPKCELKVTKNTDELYQLYYRFKYPYCVICNKNDTINNIAYNIDKSVCIKEPKQYTLKIKGLCFTLYKYNESKYISYSCFIESRPYKSRNWDDIFGIQTLTEELIHEKHIKDFINDVIKLINLPKAKI